jgi:hypothetical protein
MKMEDRKGEIKACFAACAELAENVVADNTVINDDGLGISVVGIVDELGRMYERSEEKNALMNATLAFLAGRLAYGMRSCMEPVEVMQNNIGILLTVFEKALNAKKKKDGDNGAADS